MKATAFWTRLIPHQRQLGVVTGVRLNQLTRSTATLPSIRGIWGWADVPGATGYTAVASAIGSTGNTRSTTCTWHTGTTSSTPHTAATEAARMVSQATELGECTWTAWTFSAIPRTTTPTISSPPQSATSSGPALPCGLDVPALRDVQLSPAHVWWPTAAPRRICPRHFRAAWSNSSAV